MVCLSCICNGTCAHKSANSLFVVSYMTHVSVADSIMAYSGGELTVNGPLETASIFATYPSDYITLGRSFLDQVSKMTCVNFKRLSSSVACHV